VLCYAVVVQLYAPVTLLALLCLPAQQYA